MFGMLARSLLLKKGSISDVAGTPNGLRWAAARAGAMAAATRWFKNEDGDSDGDGMPFKPSIPRRKADESMPAGKPGAKFRADNSCGMDDELGNMGAKGRAVDGCWFRLRMSARLSISRSHARRSICSRCAICSCW